MKETRLYQRIYAVANRVPRGKVTTYGDIARIVGNCGARNVGYAMAAANDEVAWHRVINAKGEISARASFAGENIQRQLLEQEGVQFNERGKIDLGIYRWDGETGPD